MNQCRLLLLISIITLCGCSREVEVPDPVGTAITNVTTIDAENGVRENQTVVWDGDEIISVGPSADAPAAATVVDGSGKFLIPGLWDMHVHFLYQEALTDVMGGLFLDYGITSVRDTGGDLAEMQRITGAMADDPSPEPNVYYSGPLLDGRFVVYDGGDPGRPKLGTGIPDAATARLSRRCEAARCRS